MPLTQIATIAERIGQSKKKEIKQHLSDETGLKEKQINEALPGVQSAFKGAEIAQSKGMDPHKVGVQNLQKMDPGKDQKKEKPLTKEQINNQEILTVALLSTLTPLVAHVIGGPRAGHITAEGNSKIGGIYSDAKRYEDKKEQHNAERSQDVSFKKETLKIQGKTAEGLAGKRIHDQTHQDQMAKLREREVIAKEQKALLAGGTKDEQGNPVLKPTKLSAGQFNQLQSLQSSKKMLDSLRQDALDHPELFGIPNSAINKLNPFKINDPAINAMKLKLKKVAITTGASVKGLPLTQEEAHSWENDLTSQDSVPGLMRKLDLFEEMRREKEASFINTAKINNQPLPGFEESQGYPVEKVNDEETKDKPDFSKMTPEQLKKYLEGKQ
jgi:hypothetical protein